MGLFGYRLLLKKHSNKIIFKCVNNVVKPNFKEKFAKIRTCRPYKQCTGAIQKNADAHVHCF